MKDSRYQRHLSILGDHGWQVLTRTPIVIAGVGGLGSHVVTSIARIAPVTLELWDPGVVDAPDLNRQILYTPDSLGRGKVDVAAGELARVNPDLVIRSHAEPITADSFARRSSVWQRERDPAGGSGFDPAPASSGPPGPPPFVLFDCLDSFAARSELEAIRRRTGCTVFHGGVEGWYGQATTFPGEGPGYADAFGPDFAETPAAAKPILPTTVAVIAALQVSDFVSLCTNGSPTPLTGTLAVYDGRRGSVERLEYRR